MKSIITDRRILASAMSALLLCALCWPGCEDVAPPPKTPKPKPAQSKTTLDEDYITAMAAANDFCQAWQHGYLATARSLMTKRLIRKHPDDRIRDAIISPAPNNPRHGAYQILSGQKLADGKVQFKVRLIFTYTGTMEDRIEAPVEKIVLIRDDKGQWRVDYFPIPSASLDRPGGRS